MHVSPDLLPVAHEPLAVEVEAAVEIEIEVAVAAEIEAAVAAEIEALVGSSDSAVGYCRLFEEVDFILKGLMRRVPTLLAGIAIVCPWGPFHERVNNKGSYSAAMNSEYPDNVILWIPE